MPRTRIVKFLVTETQYELVRTNARLAGFKTVAAYTRHMALEYAPTLEANIQETNKLVKKLHKTITKIALDGTNT